MIEADYLVVGAGAMGLAFTDALLAETDATVAIVDRDGRPGGHWNRAYPFVRLHQPSAFYGVNSRPLGSGLVDTIGGNAGLFELASGAEVLAYFDQVMNQQFLPTGRVHYFPLSEYVEGGKVVSLVSGAAHDVTTRKVVDSTYMHVNVPSMRPPPYEVAAGVRCVPPNALTTIGHAPAGWVVIGAGKTGIDACLWLLATGVTPDAITWIMPRDSWLLDRRNIQPGPTFFDSTAGGLALQLEASALATSIDDLFARLEAGGQLLRLDRTIRPSMYHCATVTVAELERLRRIGRIVRMGHVQSLGTHEIVLDGGSIPTSPDVAYVDCSANGTERRPVLPVFNGDRMTLQPVRTCQQVFSAAFIAHVEARYPDEAEKNELCTPIPHPDAEIDWLRTTLTNTKNAACWRGDRDLTSWLGSSRLNIQVGLDGPPTPAQVEIIGKIGQYASGAITNLERLLAGSGDGSSA
jgi:hypothetical protein